MSNKIESVYVEVADAHPVPYHIEGSTIFGRYSGAECIRWIYDDFMVDHPMVTYKQASPFGELVQIYGPSRPVGLDRERKALGLPSIGW